MIRRHLTIGLGSMVLAGLGTGLAHGSVMDFQNEVAGHADLIHHWTFEGADNAARFTDHAGSYDLEARTYGTAFTGGPDFAQGFDATTQAMVTKRTGGDRDSEGGSGAAAATQGELDTLNESVTMQMMFSPDETSLDLNPWGLGYMLARRDGGSRGYFLKQGGPGQFAGGEGINTLIGGWDDNNVKSVIAGNEVDTNAWYFWTASFEYDLLSDETTVTTYLGNMTDAASNGAFDNLVQISAVIDGSFVIGSDPDNAKLGVGGFANHNDDFESSFPGMIDQVAIYNAALDQQTIESQYALIPEPARVRGAVG